MLIRTEKVLPDGTLMVLSRSIVHHKVPEKKGANRGEVGES